MNIHIVFGIENADLRECFLHFTRSLEGRLDCGASLNIAHVKEQLAEAIKAALAAESQEEADGVIIVSDQLAPDDELFPSASHHYLDQLNLVSIATVAVVEVLPPGERLTDIDAVVPSRNYDSRWEAAIMRVCRKLAYVTPPQRVIPKEEIESVEIRSLNNIDEFRETLRIRHSVYTTMGYLETGYLATGSSLEVNYSDIRSKHYGLFVRTQDGQNRIAATARVIMTANAPQHSRRWVKQITRANRSLRQHVKRQQSILAFWMLPALESMEFAEPRKLITEEQQIWGELSRVIVRKEWRGHGFSKLLIKHILEDMDSMNVDGLVLECLQIHVGIYKQLGFEEVEERGVAAGIEATMVGMKILPRFSDQFSVAQIGVVS